MKYKFYNTSEKAWQAMKEEVLRAKEYIFLESYIFIEDELTHDFFRALKEKARSGVKVKIIIDWLGSFWMSSQSVYEYSEAGIEVLFFRRIFSRNHRKVLIIDGKTAFLGGVNVSGKYAKWLDLHMQIRDGFFIRSITRSFAKIYRLAGGMDPAVVFLVKRWPAEKSRRAIYEAKLFLADHWPFGKKSVFNRYYRQRIAKADKKITIVTPYFTPHRWLVNSLDQAMARGVAVEVLLPRSTDVGLLDAANWIFMEELSPRIKFLLLPEMIHAKVLLIDGQEGMVGSNNIDAQSFNLNFETGVIFHRKDMIKDLKSILSEWRKSASPFENFSQWRPWHYGILKFFIKLIQPVL